MALRLRWLSLGMILAVGGGVVVVTAMVRLRERFTLRNLRRVAASAGADALAVAARHLRGTTTPQG